MPSLSLSSNKRGRPSLLKTLGFVVLCLGLLVGGWFYPQTMTGVQNFGVQVFAPVMYVLRLPVTAVESIGQTLDNHWNAMVENEALKEEVARLRQAMNASAGLLRENGELRQLLYMASDRVPNPIAAKVLLDSSSPYAHSILINVGSEKEIKNGNAVLDGQGLVGRVLSTGKGVARVLMITDFNAHFPAMIAETGVQGLVHGQNNDKPVFVPAVNDFDIENGQLVVTSGVAGLFPEGIPIGRIMLKDGQMQIVPEANLQKLTQVLIDRRTSPAFVGGGE